MIRARLIDLEGVTVVNMALDDPEDKPRLRVYLAACPKIAAMVEPEEPIMLSIKEIEYGLERRTGDGTFIYRRITGPWG